MNIEEARQKYQDNAERLVKEINEVQREMTVLQNMLKKLTAEAMENNGAINALRGLTENV